MKAIIIFLSLFFLKFSFGQEMQKTMIMKKSHDTMWMTKTQYIFKTKKPMSGENDISVNCSKNASESKPLLWVNGSFYARVVFTVGKGDKLDINFTDGTKDSLFANSNQRSGVGPFGEKRTDWFSTYHLDQENIKNLTTKDIAALYIKAGPYHFTIPIEPEKKEIIKKQLILLRTKTNY